jgi:hypothetical protein
VKWRLYQKRVGDPDFAFVVHKPRAFVATWLRYQRKNTILVKQLYYAYKIEGK